MEGRLEIGCYSTDFYRGPNGDRAHLKGPLDKIHVETISEVLVSSRRMDLEELLDRIQKRLEGGSLNPECIVYFMGAPGKSYKILLATYSKLKDMDESELIPLLDEEPFRVFYIASYLKKRMGFYLE